MMMKNFYRSSRTEAGHQGPHMIYTEALTLDEALDIIAHRKRKTTLAHKQRDGFLNREFSHRPKKPVTLPKLKFMGEK
jgi:hypothetical protein